ncbi:MAG TPA: hypothetical protein VLJ88_18565 [Propionibacteriaceae bacterium]|nr:hypothetical protein [Propionibacteriaceae bacterium]
MTGWKGFAKEWAGFRLDGFVVLARLERWLLSLTAWMDRPGPSEDTIAMQPDLPDVTR